MNTHDLISITPHIVLVAWAVALLLADLYIPAERKSLTALLAAAGLAVAMGLELAQAGRSFTGFGGMIVVDGFSVFLNTLFLASGLAGVALAYNYLKRMGIERGEYYVLLMICISGMMLMGSAGDLIVVFLALELLSIPLYVLAGFARPKLESEEAALKYFLLGAFASGFVLYGIALIYGATNATGLEAIVAAVSNGSVNTPLFLIGAGLFLVGFGFKVAAVPFHMWTPDVYQGAPTPVTGFMAVGAKAAGFAALLRVFEVAFPSLVAGMTPVLWVLAVLTMLVGNVVAIAQSNIKRMLAYSSIAHAGYLMMAFVSFGDGSASANTVASVLFYLTAYALTSFGAWAVVAAVERGEGRGLELEDYAGLAGRYPLLALSMMVFMLSFIGVPPSLGFWGKFYLFRTAIQGGHLDLAIFGVLASLVSAYYYLRVIVLMYMREGQPQALREPWLNLVAGAAAFGTVAIGLIPGPLFDLAAQAVLRVF
jgi:NADH-quinone oxidoreductase subunit N